MFNIFNTSVSQIHQSNFNGVQSAQSSAAVENLDLGGQYFHNSTTLNSAANSAQKPILPVSNMNFSAGMGGWTTSVSYAPLQDNASLTNTPEYIDLNTTSATLSFNLVVQNTVSNGLRPFDDVFRVTILADPHLGSVGGVPPFGWTQSVVGGNITWTYPALNGIPPGFSSTFGWSVAAPIVSSSACPQLVQAIAIGDDLYCSDTFFQTVVVSWYNINLPARFVDEGIGTVNCTVESSNSFPNPTPLDSVASLTASPSGALPAGAQAGYDSNALTTTSESGPGSLYASFEPSFNSLPLSLGQQLNATVSFTTSFNLDPQTTSELVDVCDTIGCGFSFESSLDSLTSIPNPVIVYHAYLENKATGQTISLPIGGRTSVVLNYSSPTQLNYFGPSGWVYYHVTFYPKTSFWSPAGAEYNLVLKISMDFPGSASTQTGYPAQVSMHFDDIGLALRLNSMSYYGSSDFEFQTKIPYQQVQGVELGLNVSETGATSLPTSVYAFLADNSRFAYNPTLWFQVGSLTLNSSGFIHATIGLPDAAYFFNASTSQLSPLGDLGVRLEGVSAYGAFTLHVTAYAVVETTNQTRMVAELLNENNVPMHMVGFYLTGPNLAVAMTSSLSGSSNFDHWVSAGQTVVVPLDLQWLPNQIYTVTVTTDSGLSFSSSFTAPNA